MKLKTYIESVGTAAFAKQFKISVRAAESYRYGTRRPKPDLAHRIVSRTDVTWAGIYPKEQS